jgi:hypothetical protein
MLHRQLISQSTRHMLQRPNGRPPENHSMVLQGHAKSIHQVKSAKGMGNACYFLVISMGM